MQCPYCYTELEKSASYCTQCNLSLPSLRKKMGPMPHIHMGLTDKRGLLDPDDATRIRKNLARLNKNFPQVEMHICLQSFGAEFPISTYLFWLFNDSGICRENRKGAANHSILLLIDPEQSKAGLMVGYGLEPFLKTKSMDSVLEKSHHELYSGEYAKGINEIIDSVDKMLIQAHDNLRENAEPQKTLQTITN